MTTLSDTENMKDRAKRLTQDARDSVAETAREQGEEVRDAAVEQADKVADAARDARQNFDSSSLQAEALKAVSQQIEGVTQRLRDRPIEDLIDDAAVFARRNPLLVLGGAAILGFAAARFLKAEPRTHRAESEDPWSYQAHTDPRGTS